MWGRLALSLISLFSFQKNLPETPGRAPCSDSTTRPPDWFGAPLQSGDSWHRHRFFGHSQGLLGLRQLCVNKNNNNINNKSDGRNMRQSLKTYQQHACVFTDGRGPPETTPVHSTKKNKWFVPQYSEQITIAKNVSKKRKVKKRNVMEIYSKNKLLPVVTPCRFVLGCFVLFHLLDFVRLPALLALATFFYFVSSILRSPALLVFRLLFFNFYSLDFRPLPALFALYMCRLISSISSPRFSSLTCFSPVQLLPGRRAFRHALL